MPLKYAVPHKRKELRVFFQEKAVQMNEEGKFHDIITWATEGLPREEICFEPLFELTREAIASGRVRIEDRDSYPSYHAYYNEAFK